MELRDRRVLVTGGAGFIGSHVVDELVRRGARVTVLDDLSAGKLEHLGQAGAHSSHLRILRGDVGVGWALREAVKGAEVVFHLAVACLRLSIEQPEAVHEVNATGTLRVLEEARRQGVSRLVYVSSSEVYGTAQTVPMTEEHPLLPTTPYGASKAAGELYARSYRQTYGLPVVIVRPFNAYGPRGHFEGVHGEVIPKFFVRALAEVPPVLFGDGLQTRDFSYVTDTARGIVECGACDALVGEAVNVARGEETAIGELCSLVLELTGGKHLSPVRQAGRPADVRRHLGDVRKAEQACGFRAEVGLEDGLRRYLEWLRHTGERPRTMLELDVEHNWRRAELEATGEADGERRGRADEPA